MTIKDKELILSAFEAVIKSIPLDNEQSTNEIKTTANSGPEPTEMLSIKECSQLIKGLSEGTIRQLVAQGKLPHIRAGAGVRGRILIPKTALISYCSGATTKLKT